MTIQSLLSAADPSLALLAVPMPFEAIPRSTWDRLLAATPSATPFSRWTFHRAWWDAYGSTAHEQYLVCLPLDGAARPGLVDATDAVAIVPLMHRHEVEPSDLMTATHLRRPRQEGAHVADEAKAVFMAASYHADYATLLASPRDLPDVAAVVAHSLAGPPDPDHGDRAWDVVDLRRLRATDPALHELEAAFERSSSGHGWRVLRESEDVCPVVDISDRDWEGYLAGLGKKARHEIRRKLRRASNAGEVRFRLLPLDAASVRAFIDLHQARWGDAGLFPPTAGGERSRRFLARLTELESAEGEDAQLQLGEVSVGGRVIFASVGFDDGVTCYFYNAGFDPAAMGLSPGITGTAAYIRDRLSAGRRRFDFLRGDEPYKYEWGAVDEPIERLLVFRAAPL